MKQPKTTPKPKHTYSTSVMTLTDGKRISLCLPDDMTDADYDILERYIALQKEAMEREPDATRTALADADA